LATGSWLAISLDEVIAVISRLSLLVYPVHLYSLDILIQHEHDINVRKAQSRIKTKSQHCIAGLRAAKT